MDRIKAPIYSEGIMMHAYMQSAQPDDTGNGDPPPKTQPKKQPIESPADTK